MRESGILEGYHPEFLQRKYDNPAEPSGKKGFCRIFSAEKLWESYDRDFKCDIYLQYPS